MAAYTVSPGSCGSGTSRQLYKDGILIGNIQIPCGSFVMSAVLQSYPDATSVNGVLKQTCINTIVQFEAGQITRDQAIAVCSGVTPAGATPAGVSGTITPSSSSSNLLFYLGLGILGLALFGGKK